MTRTEAIAQIQASLTELTADQLAALAELAESWKRATPPEDAATRAAIAEGLVQAERGELAAPADVDQLLNQPWK